MLTVKENVTVSVEFESAVIPVQKFNITLTQPTANGSVSAKVDGKPLTFTENKAQVEKGKTIVFTAAPAAGYRVKKWTGTDNPASTDKTAVLTVKENAAVSVEFESAVIPVQKFEITLTQPTANGSVSAAVDGNPLTFTKNKAQVEKGKTIVFTAVPAAGYRVKKWKGTDNPASTDKTAVLTVKENATVSVEFEAIGQLFNITFDTPQNGTLEASLDGAPFSGGEVQEGKIIVFTAEPAPTYRVRNWTGLEYAGTEPIVTLTVTKAVHVSVEFINVPEYTITFNQPEHGSLTATLDGVPFDGTQKVAEGKHIVFTAIPETGYRLLKWENVNTDPEHGYVKVHTVQADKTVSVIFETDDILIIRKNGQGKHYVKSCKKTAEGKIEVPDYVKYIEDEAFKDCIKVTEVKLPAGLTKIGSAAFYGCTGLTSISLPAGLTQIKSAAFYGCTGLTSISLPARLTQIGSTAFYGCTGLTSISLPAGVTEIKSAAFSGCTWLTSITIPAGVTKIGLMAFLECTGLKDITIEAMNITEIESNAFDHIHAEAKFTVKVGSNVKQKLIDYGIDASKIEEV